MTVLAAAESCPAQSMVLSESTSPGMPALEVAAGVIHGPTSMPIAPPPPVKLLSPFVFALLLKMPCVRKFICRMMLVSDVSWNSGVVSPAEARMPWNL